MNTCHPSTHGHRGSRIGASLSPWPHGKFEDAVSKTKTRERKGEGERRVEAVAHKLESLPNMHKALTLITNPA